MNTIEMISSAQSAWKCMYPQDRKITSSIFQNIKVISLLLILIQFSACTNLFYYPHNDLLISPKEIGISYEDLWIEHPGQPKLHGWYMPSVKISNRLILHLHGNAENISTHLASVYWMPSKGLPVITVDYRGYGLSEGDVSIDGIHYDIERTVKYIKSRTDLKDKEIILYGQSLGAAMAIYTAAQSSLKNDFSAVIAESPFASYRGIVQEKLAENWITYPFQWLLPYLVTDKYSALNFIDKIPPVPLLLIHGTEDKTVNVKNSEILCEKIGQNCMFWKISGADHISIFRDYTNQQKLVEFINSKSG